MARAFFERLAPHHEAESTGVRPGAQIDPLVVTVMERGIDLHGRTPRGLDANAARDADVVVRCIALDPDDFEWPAGPAHLDWALPLPLDTGDRAALQSEGATFERRGRLRRECSAARS